MKKLDQNQLKNLQEFVLKTTKLKSTNISLIAQKEDKKETFSLVSIADKEKSNKVLNTVVINSKNEIVEWKDFHKSYSKDFFAFYEELKIPEIFKKDIATISPNINNLILNICDRFGEKLNVHIPAKPNRNVDVYFLIDTTGSMGAAIDNVKININSLVTSLTASYPAIAFGVGEFKDFNSGDPFCYNNALPMTQGNTGLVSSAINALSANGGGDFAEGQLFALDRISEPSSVVGWRTNTTKIVILIGDYPAHNPICASVSGLAYDITLDHVITKLQNENIRVLGLSVGANMLDSASTDSYNACPGFISAGDATRYTTETNGQLISGVNVSNLSTAIVNIINSSLNIIRNVSLVPSGAIRSFICSINPSHGYSNLDASVPHDLEFIVCFKGAKLCGRMDRHYSGTLDVVLDDAIVVSKKVTIEVPACHSKGKCNCC